MRGSNPPASLIKHATQLGAPLYCQGGDFRYASDTDNTWHYPLIQIPGK